MKVLLIGSGGREHALAWKMNQSPLLDALYASPGNAGIKDIAEVVDLDVKNQNEVSAFCHKHEISLVVIGPEQPLVDGLADHLAEQGIPVIGPSAEGAQLEGSKSFAKAFMARHDIPTAQYESFKKESLQAGLDYIDTMSTPVVLKADGLAAGKGVLICQTHQEAKQELEAMLSGKFGEASSSVVIEEFLDGIEFSVFALTDGKEFVLLPSAKDYKRAFDGDKGLNTGGMGTVSPVDFVNDTLMDKVVQRIVRPTIEGLHKEGISYCGFVFFGLINVGGDPYVIEYNSRLGDPETQVILPRIKNDLLSVFQSTVQGKISEVVMGFHSDYTVAVILASGGYPGSYEKGKTIDIRPNHGLVFHAGTALSDGQLVTSGGRVLACCGQGSDLKIAIDNAYTCAEHVTFEGKFHRSDIGQDVLNYG